MQPRLEPSPSRMDGYKGKLWKLPVTFSFAKNQFFSLDQYPWKLSQVREYCCARNSQKKFNFLRMKLDEFLLYDFQSQNKNFSSRITEKWLLFNPPPLTYYADWTLISPEKLYLPYFLKKVVSQFPERNLPSITKVSAPLDGWVEPDEGFVATEYKKEIQVTKKKIIPTTLIYVI